MKTLKVIGKIILLIFVLIGIFFILLFILGKLLFGNIPQEKIISHSYKVDEEKYLIIDTWDCGATCSYNTKVHLQIFGERLEEKILLDCRHISDIELSEITFTTAKIVSVSGDNPECEYQEGDIISF